jgi:hypothetical protein
MPHATVLVEPAAPRSLALVSDALCAEGFEVSGPNLLVKVTDDVVDRVLDEAIDRVATAVKAAWLITVRRKD